MKINDLKSVSPGKYLPDPKSFSVVMHPDGEENPKWVILDGLEFEPAMENCHPGDSVEVFAVSFDGNPPGWIEIFHNDGTGVDTRPFNEDLVKFFGKKIGESF